MNDDSTDQFLSYYNTGDPALAEYNLPMLAADVANTGNGSPFFQLLLMIIIQMVVD
jgi:hypothetical protein